MTYDLSCKDPACTSTLQWVQISCDTDHSMRSYPIPTRSCPCYRAASPTSAWRSPPHRISARAPEPPSPTPHRSSSVIIPQPLPGPPQQQLPMKGHLPGPPRRPAQPPTRPPRQEQQGEEEGLRSSAPRLVWHCLLCVPQFPFATPRGKRSPSRATCPGPPRCSARQALPAPRPLYNHAVCLKVRKD